jgi:hypothetical protein
MSRVWNKKQRERMKALNVKRGTAHKSKKV